MLDVEGADDVDAGVEELEHVLVALLVAAAGHVGVRELVDDRDLRLAREDGVEVHLLDGDAAILDLAPRHVLEARDELRGLGAAVRLDEAEHDVDAALLERVRLLEHAVGLADAGGEADVELEPPALAPLDELEEVFGTLVGWLPHCGRLARRPAELAVEREVQQEHVDARLAEEAEVAALDRALDDAAHALGRDAARLGHARHLPQRGRGREVRVEAARRRGHELDRDAARRVRVLLVQSRDVGRDAVAQLLRRGAEVRAAEAVAS